MKEEKGTVFIGFIICLVILFFIMPLMDSESIRDNREKNNMILLEENYCYEKNTRIIYIENEISRTKYSSATTTYTPYINENGNFCKYINGQWVEVIKGE